MSQFVDVVVGGQYGSEAKGHVTAQIVKQAARSMREQIDGDVRIFNVRVAGPNAGHTVYDAQGRKYAFRSLPVGMVVNPEVVGYIAPGSEIDLDVLYGEIQEATNGGHSLVGRLYVSRQATLIETRHKEQETALVGAVGSTGKGIGAARADRLMRGAETLGAWLEHELVPWEWAEPEDLYATDDIVHEQNTHVIVEGTQGYGLSLRASGHYPQVTSSDARAVDFLAMAGIDPTRCSVKIQNWVVCRVFPIRVAGNSGPMKGETSWQDLGLDEELTTVTQKVRRVGEWDLELVRRAVQANGGHQANVVITMLDQVIPELKALAGITLDPESELPESSALDQAIDWLNTHASREQIGAHVAAFTFSPVDLLWTPAAQPEPQNLDALVQGMLGGLLGEIAGGASTDAEGEALR